MNLDTGSRITKDRVSICFDTVDIYSHFKIAKEIFAVHCTVKPGSLTVLSVMVAICFGHV